MENFQAYAIFIYFSLALANVYGEKSKGPDEVINDETGAELSGGVAFSNGGPENVQSYQIPGMGLPNTGGKPPFILINNVPPPNSPEVPYAQQQLAAASASAPYQVQASVQAIIGNPQLMNVLCSSILGQNYQYSAEVGYCQQR